VAATSASIPSTYEQACASEGAVCLPGAAGSIPGALKRPLHFPVLQPGDRCPASRGRAVNTPSFAGIALGNGPVRVLIDNAGDLSHGIGILSRVPSSPGWLAFKAHWFSTPTYSGPFVVRAKRLGRPGPIARGETPTSKVLVVPPGPTVNGGSGWREAPDPTWVKSAGCYAWQVDGLGFSETIVVSARSPR